jgi:hypothetical protein
MRHRRGRFGRSLAASAAGIVFAGIVFAGTVVMTSGSAGLAGESLAADDELELPVPGVGPTEAQNAPEAPEAQEAVHSGPVEDRSPHSFGPSMPADICADPTKTCGFAETH